MLAQHVTPETLGSQRYQADSLNSHPFRSLLGNTAATLSTPHLQACGSQMPSSMPFSLP